ncbi:MAG: DUF1501 domain-containing protein [Planctomycetota bacterium]|nr:DUF1501 domain-containing protein [Planctomycetota bacterium]
MPRTWLLDRDLSRRVFLRSTSLGTGLLSLPHVLQWQAQAAPAQGAKKRSLILLWQDGGASHLETFDPKPEAPSEYRGELGAISTSLPGVSYCEVLPRLARLAHRTSVIRSLHQPSSDHVVGSHNVLTGWDGETEGSKSRYPDLGAVINRMRSGTEEDEVSIGASTDPRLAKGMRGAGGRPAASHDGRALPQYIDIGAGLHRGGPAFLGPIAGPFQVAGDPSKPGFVIQNLDSVSSARQFLTRQEMLTQLDRFGRSVSANTAAYEQFQAIDGFRQQAIDLLSGGGAARAFDLSRERPEVRERYGAHLAGQQCLLARRLVDAGVGTVAIRFSPDGRGDYDRTMIGWDDHAVHGNIFEIMRQRGPQFDQSVSALIEDLDERGMADDVLVVVVGEFGRTPRIHVHKGCPGREHWGPAGCALVYGGGLRMGQIVGSTNDKGEHPRDRPLTYQCLLATIYHALGIDPAHTFINQAGRPVPILPTGESIAELTGVNSRNDGRAKSASPTKPSLHEAGAKPNGGRTVALPAGATNADLAALLDRGNLDTLVLHDARIDDDGLAAIADCRSLRCLQLNGTPATDNGLVHLGKLTALEELNLTGTRTTDAGLAHLKPLVRLRRLAFNGTSVSLGGVVRLFVHDQRRPLVEALSAMGLTSFDEQGNVVAINVAGTSFGDEELQHLGPLTTLRELHLAATRVTDRGMAHVGELANLERVYLAKCEVSDAGLAHLARLIRLRAINLYGTKLTSAGLEHLSGLEQLRLLSVTDVKLNPAAVDRLKSKLPRLTVTDYTPV